jgi:hydroxyethylthiazole kinase-like uncharacterized protein yjeF
MGAVTNEEVLASEAAAKTKGWTERQLLKLAGERLGRAIGRYFPHPGTAIGYLGKGHNAGDALVALRILRDDFHWKIGVRAALPPNECSPLTQEKWQELGNPQPIETSLAWRDSLTPLLLLDGLLGSGAKGALREPFIALTAEMERLRQNAGARVASVDLPSGVDPNHGTISAHAVTADVTFMIGNAKLGLLRGCAATACGALVVVPVEPLTWDGTADVELIAPQLCEFGKVPRPFDFHKGQAGRVALLVGSENYSGAAVLAATGALRAGAGLVTLFVPRAVVPLVASRCPAEIMIRGFRDPREILHIRSDALVIGCGLGEMDEETADRLLEVISQSLIPTVVDADALNLIAKRNQLHILSEKHILTPHPGEFTRLAPDAPDISREDLVRWFVKRTPATLLLKGSRTLVHRRERPVRCNSTGSPGMAGGGQGDTLSGVIGARLGSGDSPFDAASLAAWLCGRAAEIALNHQTISEESLTAGDVANFLGAAYRDWHCETR